MMLHDPKEGPWGPPDEGFLSVAIVLNMRRPSWPQFWPSCFQGEQISHTQFSRLSRQHQRLMLVGGYSHPWWQGQIPEQVVCWQRGSGKIGQACEKGQGGTRIEFYALFSDADAVDAKKKGAWRTGNVSRIEATLFLSQWES